MLEGVFGEPGGLRVRKEGPDRTLFIGVFNQDQHLQLRMRPDHTGNDLAVGFLELDVQGEPERSVD